MAHIFNLFLFFTVGNIRTLTPFSLLSVSSQNGLSVKPVLTCFFGVATAPQTVVASVMWLSRMVEAKCFLAYSSGAG